MSRVNPDTLRELLIYLMIENAQARAAASPLIMDPFLAVDQLPAEFDKALDEVNGHRHAEGAKPLVVDDSYKQAVIDSLLVRMENQGRMQYAG